MRRDRRKSLRQQRGFSLIEAMIAGGILIIGLTGVTMMMIRGSQNGRNGQQSAESAQIITAVIADFEATGFDNLVLSPVGASFDGGTSIDGGVYYDASGRPYGITYVVADITGTMPTGPVVIPTYTVDVEVSYRDGSGRTVFKRGGTIMSRAPDAGP